jgi:uncharacterized protein
MPRREILTAFFINLMIPVKEHPCGLVVKIFVQPRSSRNEAVGMHGDALKIRLTAPPVDGEANKTCIDFLSKRLNVSKSSIEIISGRTGRTKQILLRFDEGHDPTKERVRLMKMLASFCRERP